MPWEAKDVMQLRIEFVLRAAKEEMPFSRLCEEFGISRRTGYRWRSRYEEAGSVLALREHSRRPHRSPRKTPEALHENAWLTEAGHRNSAVYRLRLSSR